MLALAGCDLEIPKENKVDYIPGLIMKGKAEITKSGVDSIEAYFYPMFGVWDVDAYLNNEAKESETVASGEGWYSGVHSAHITMSEGDTLRLEVKPVSGDIFTPFFETNDGTDYISINPNDGNVWGDLATYSGQIYNKTSFEEGITYVFTLTWSGNVCSYTLGTL